MGGGGGGRVITLDYRARDQKNRSTTFHWRRVRLSLDDSDPVWRSRDFDRSATATGVNLATQFETVVDVVVHVVMLVGRLMHSGIGEIWQSSLERSRVTSDERAPAQSDLLPRNHEK